MNRIALCVLLLALATGLWGLPPCAAAQSASDIPDRLVRDLYDESREVRQRAAKRLMRRGEAAVPVFLEALDARPQREAIQALIAMGTDVLPAILDRIETVNGRVNMQLTPIVASMGESALPALLEGAIDRSPVVRAWSFQALRGAAPGAEETKQALLRGAQDADDRARAAAICCLGKLRTVSPPMLQAIERALHDESAKVRRCAARAVEWMGPPSDQVIIPNLAHPDEEVRRILIAGLGRLPEQTAVPHLVKALEDGKKSVRLEAVRSLGRVGAPAAILLPAVQPLLEDEDLEGRLIAIQALGRAGK
jgi:HEAT repeat protein